MTFFIEDTSLIISHVLYKTAVIIAVLRWIFACILRYRSRSSSSSLSSSSQSSSPPSQTIKESLGITAFRDAVERSPASTISDTCAVCLGDLEDDDEIRELRNCTHVFHRDCIDRWLDYECRGGDEDDNHRTCPLCRTPLLPSFTDCSNVNQPSWAVERLLYLFGDDLLP